MTFWDLLNEWLLCNYFVRYVFLFLVAVVVGVSAYAVLVQRQTLSLGPLKIGGKAENGEQRKRSPDAIDSDRKVADLSQTRPVEGPPGVGRVEGNDLGKGVRMGGLCQGESLKFVSSDWARFGDGWVKSGWLYMVTKSDLSHAVAFFKMHLWDNGDGYVRILSASNTVHSIWLETDTGFKREQRFSLKGGPDDQGALWKNVRWKR